MIPLLPRWYLMPNRPSFYDTDSKTLLELASTLHATMNDLIEDYNNFVDATNDAITEFTEQTAENQEKFAIALRQEFQDFINVVELKITSFNNELNAMSDRITYMEENQISITKNIINRAIEDGRLDFVETYDEETESLRMFMAGGV